MGVPWDSTSADTRSSIDDIVRSAVAYGYLRGLHDASSVSHATAASQLSSEDRARRNAFALEVAEQFLRKVYAEQLAADPNTGS